jgi:hypothetical protein
MITRRLVTLGLALPLVALTAYINTVLLIGLVVVTGCTIVLMSSLSIAPNDEPPMPPRTKSAPRPMLVAPKSQTMPATNNVPSSVTAS